MASPSIANMPWLQPAYDHLVGEVRANRQAHALLVQGDGGIGIQALADTFLHYRLCDQPLENACGQCKSCHLLGAQTHPDIQMVTPSGASDMIKVEQVRAVVNFLSQTPQIAKWKLVCVTAAHRMNVNAANALLKILEEPPGNSLIVLVSDRPQLLIPTVRSRCRNLDVGRPSEAETKAFCLANGVSEEQLTELIPILGLRPVKIASWVQDEQYQQWKLLLDGLDKFKKNDLTASELTELLKDLSLMDILEWLMQLAASRAKLAVVANIHSHWATFYEWLAGRRLNVEHGSNPNRQLLLDECFFRWKAIVL